MRSARKSLMRLLLQLVAVARVEVEAIDLFKLPDALQRGALERGLAFEGMQHDALEEVAQGDVVVLGHRLEDLEQAFFELYAGLDALDLDLGATTNWLLLSWHLFWYSCTYVPTRPKKMGLGPHFLENWSG